MATVELTAGLRAAGFVPGEERTVLIGLTAELATVPVLPGGVVLRQVTADDDMQRIAALQSAVWARTGTGSARTSSPGSPPPRRASRSWPRRPMVTSSPRIPCGHHHRLRVDTAAARQTRMTHAAGPDLTIVSAAHS
ncbi:MAG TPA: hypothetical protein VE464_07815 [Streptosporangiaceae bacterium]|nr:hypothetical protein [Streptosporangiaceae bacterium]